MKALIGNVISNGRSLGRRAVCFEGTLIKDIVDVDRLVDGVEVVADYGDLNVSAAFIDLHVNGAGGKVFQFDRTDSSVEIMARALMADGTVYFVPVISATDIEEYREVRNHLRNSAQRLTNILGVHYEGPYIDESKVGFGRQDCVGEGAVDHRDIYYDLIEDMKVMMTVAPEVLERDRGIEMVYDGVILSFGHTSGKARDASELGILGAKYCTHLFNGMPPVTGREAGVAGVCLSKADIVCSLILDGFHLAPETVDLVWKMKRSDKVCLISDGMPPLGSDLKEFQYRDITIKKSDEGALLADGGALSGTCVPLNKMCRRLMDITGARLDKAIDTITRAPAGVLGLSNEIGDIRVGSKASFAVFDKDINIEAVYQSGDAVV